jgi:aspartate carbamoyltransferase catalytic subunit
MSFKNRDIISINDFSKDELLYILKIAKKMESKPQSDLLKGNILATLFFEPSTRTRLSFISAIEQLGGQYLGFANSTMTSIKKGETLWDTMKMVQSYADVIAIRHPLEGAARLAAKASSKPVINAGDGANQHPTQTLLDLYTILKVKGTLNGLTIGVLGDLKYGRTVHSLAKALSHFNTTFHFIAPNALQMPKNYLEDLKNKGLTYYMETDISKSSKKLDVLYATRIQKERFQDPIEYEKYKGVYRLNIRMLKDAKKSLKIMHPLPRVDEIDKELDDSEHAVYFEQAANGVHVRKALLALVLGKIK